MKIKFLIKPFLIKIVSRFCNKSKNYDKDRAYYLKNKDRVLLNRSIDRDLQRISRKLNYIMGYENMLETLRYIKKTYYSYE